MGLILETMEPHFGKYLGKVLMNICYDCEQGVFKLDTPCSSYVMALTDGKWLGQV